MSDTTDDHACKPGATTYYCPTAGDTESDCHGGFDICCARPDLHQQLLPCSWAFLRRDHGPHSWEPQPGMTPVRCEGHGGAEATSLFRTEAGFLTWVMHGQSPAQRPDADFPSRPYEGGHELGLDPVVLVIRHPISDDSDHPPTRVRDRDVSGTPDVATLLAQRGQCRAERCCRVPYYMLHGTHHGALGVGRLPKLLAPPQTMGAPFSRMESPMSGCDHEWTQWSGKQRCRKCGATQ